MEANKILSADILDLVFEDRNKEYGAYELRKTYNKRIIMALDYYSFCCCSGFDWVQLLASTLEVRRIK